jgi:hypothetical protein
MEYQRIRNAAIKRGERHLSTRWENSTIPIHKADTATRKAFWDQMRADLLAGIKKYGRFAEE